MDFSGNSPGNDRFLTGISPGTVRTSEDFG